MRIKRWASSPDEDDLLKGGAERKVEVRVKRMCVFSFSAQSYQNLWLEHMILSGDAVSDPPTVRVRAARGINAVDYLEADKSFMKVMG